MEAPSLSLQTFDMVIFGGTGDLAFRKLLPALFRRFVDGQIAGGSRVIGVAREPLTVAAYRDFAEAALRRAVPEADPGQLRHFLNRLGYHALDAGADAGWTDLAASCTASGPRLRVFYLSTPPALYAGLCRRLAAHSLNGPEARVVLEKPIGHDAKSAAAINGAVGAVFPEARIFRIDHYLGKETVQNLLALRFGNVLFEPLWNAAHIARVQITVAEDMGVGTRGAYYEGVGALRDMVQNHLLQLLCMVAMEPPASLDPEAVRTEKLKVLRALQPLRGSDVARLTVRGQYTAGAAGAGYLQEIGRAASRTETFVALRAALGNWRWAGVPFYLCTGKRLPERVSEIVVDFHAIPHSIFPGVEGAMAPNRLMLRLQPHEGIRLGLMGKYPDSDGMQLRPVSLDMTFADAFGLRPRDAYERLLLDVVRGDPTLFMHRDEIDAAWRWIDPIEEAWDAVVEAPFAYAAGSWGPPEARLFLRPGESPGPLPAAVRSTTLN